MAYLDYNERQLFTGDELDAGQVLLSREKLPAHLANMEKLKTYAADFDIINPAHNGTHLLPDILDDFIELDKRVIAGTIEPLEERRGLRLERERLWRYAQQEQALQRRRRPYRRVITVSTAKQHLQFPLIDHHKNDRATKKRWSGSLFEQRSGTPASIPLRFDSPRPCNCWP